MTALLGTSRYGQMLSGLRDLQCFIAVAERSHVSRAAEHLSMEQSSVSRAVKRLEAELGCDLLVHRKGRAGELTEAGQITFAIGKEILDLYRTLLERISALSSI